MLFRSGIVHDSMGIPCAGHRIDVEKVEDGNQIFKDYKSVYGQMTYKQIGERLWEINEIDTNFELKLFGETYL